MEGFCSCTVQIIPVIFFDGTIEEIVVRVWQAHNSSLNNLTWCFSISCLEPVGASLSSVSEADSFELHRECNKFCEIWFSDVAMLGDIMNLVHNLCHCECWEVNMELSHEMEKAIGR